MTRKTTKAVRDARYRANSNHPGWSIIDQAKERLLRFGPAAGIQIHSIHYVATFEEWDDGIGVWVFFPTDRELAEHTGSATTKTLEDEYLKVLRELNYPFHKFPRVTFVFDSDENVQRNYEGSYFYRLR